jgi:hypothetical protein
MRRKIGDHIWRDCETNAHNNMYEKWHFLNMHNKNYIKDNYVTKVIHYFQSFFEFIIKIYKEKLNKSILSVTYYKNVHDRKSAYFAFSFFDF